MAQLDVDEEGKQYPTPKEKAKEENMIDLQPESNDAWWYYTYNVNNKYFINLQWKMSGSGKHPWRKHGVRLCTINGKPVKILAFSNNPNPYNNGEYVRLQAKNAEYRLYYIKDFGWCFDDGQGVVCNVKRENNGKLKE